MIALKLCARARVVTGEATNSLNAMTSLEDKSSSNDAVLNLHLCEETLGVADGNDNAGVAIIA